MHLSVLKSHPMAGTHIVLKKASFFSHPKLQNDCQQGTSCFQSSTPGGSSVCEGSGVRLLCFPGSCLKGGGIVASKCRAWCYFKKPERSFPTGSQDNKHELRAIKQRSYQSCWTHTWDGTKYPCLEHFGTGLLPARPFIRRLVCQGRCGQAHFIGLALLTLTVLPHSHTLPPGLEPDPVAWCFSRNSTDGLAPYLHGLTVSCLPTHPI